MGGLDGRLWRVRPHPFFLGCVGGRASMEAGRTSQGRTVSGRGCAPSLGGAGPVPGREGPGHAAAGAEPGPNRRRTGACGDQPGRPGSFRPSWPQA